MQRRQGQQGLVQIVFREHQQRAPGGYIQLQQALGQSPHSLAHLGIVQAEPAGATAFGEVGTLGRLHGPVFEPLPDAAGIGLQWLGGTQHEAAVGTRFIQHLGRGQLGRIIEEIVHCTPS